MAAGASGASAASDLEMSCPIESLPSDTSRGIDSETQKTSRKRNTATGTAISGDFIRVSAGESAEFHFHRTDRLKSWAKRVTSNKFTTQAMAGVILFDAYCNCGDIDARALGNKAPEVYQVGAAVCLVLYTLEASLVLFGQGLQVLHDRVFLIDLCVIICGYVEMILDALSSEAIVASFGILRLLRLARVMRLLRLLRKSRALRELQKLVIMMSTCMKALIWSFIFCFVIMTVWAMLMVEMVHPIIQDLHKDDPGIFGDCEQCLRATQSVMDANLLLFKTVIAGDSWGLIAVPVIEKHPATAIIFVGSLLTLVFGVLNLIVAVVVDTFADARDRDILNLAEEMEQDMEADKRFLERIFNRIDVEKSGHLSLEKLVDGARKDAEFQSRLRVMDIDEVDLAQLFDMIDTDGSGFIESNEFIRPLSRWVHDSKTAPRFIKYNLMRTMQQQEEIQAEQSALRQSIEKNFNAISERMDLISQPSSPLITRSAIPRDLCAPDRLWEHVETQPMEAVLSRRDEGVEQPHPSKKVTTLVQKMEESEANLQESINRLEDLVMKATESALKDSTDLIGHMLLEKLKTSPISEELHFAWPTMSTSCAAAPHAVSAGVGSAVVEGTEERDSGGRPPDLGCS